MSPEVSERAFEEAIECALLRDGPDACPGDATAVRESPPAFGGEPAPGGYRRRPPEDYDRALCLLPTDVVDLLLATQPKEWEKLKQHHGADVQPRFLGRLSREIARRGALDVLRNGVKDSGCKFRLAYFRPTSGLNDELQRLHARAAGDEPQPRARIVRNQGTGGDAGWTRNNVERRGIPQRAARGSDGTFVPSGLVMPASRPRTSTACAPAARAGRPVTSSVSAIGSSQAADSGRVREARVPLSVASNWIPSEAASLREAGRAARHSAGAPADACRPLVPGTCVRLVVCRRPLSLGGRPAARRLDLFLQRREADGESALDQPLRIFHLAWREIALGIPIELGPVALGPALEEPDPVLEHCRVGRIRPSFSCGCLQER